MTEANQLADRARRIREAFDSGFAEPPAGEPPAHLDLLAIRCAERDFVLRLSDVRSVSTDRKIVAVPAPAPELLGLVGVRGVVAPVYDLSALLGYPGTVAPRWLALVRAPAPFAVGFEGFEQYLRVPASDVIMAPADAHSPHPFAGGSVKTASGPRPLIDLVALFSAVTGRRKNASEREDSA